MRTNKNAREVLKMAFIDEIKAKAKADEEAAPAAFYLFPSLTGDFMMP